MGMTGKERIRNILNHKPVDRIGLFEHFWGDTQKAWAAQGHIQPDEDLADHFGFDMSLCWNFNMVADLDYENEVVEETDDTILMRDGNGALLRRHKLHNATPEHVGFNVTDRDSWNTIARPHLLEPDERRIDFESYNDAMRQTTEKDRFFMWSGVNVFELMHPVCGHEYMLLGMRTDPEWISDMCEVYSDLIIGQMEILFEKAGKPDGIWFYEDMGYKDHPFMSPEMYRHFILPAHKKTFDFAHAHDLPVIVHSCGFVEPLIPGLIEAGMDCLQVMEIKAGMDPIRIKKQYGDKIALCGGLDARNLVANDRDAIQKELSEKLPVLANDGAFILHSDHSIPNQCEYETYRFFVDKGLEIAAGSINQ